MTPQEKATAGIWLLKQAVLDYLADQPDHAATPRTIGVALGMNEQDPVSGRKRYMLWGLSNQMILDMTVRREPRGPSNRQHLVLVSPAA